MHKIWIVALSVVFGIVANGYSQDAKADGPDWKLAVQTWTFNKMSLFEALDTLTKIGVKYVEIYPGQKISSDTDAKFGPGMDAATRDKVKAKLKECGIKLVNTGVTGASGEEGWRKLFEFAKDMGIETIVSEPAEKDLEMIDKLCGEYGINVAIHNHPKPSHYWDPDVMLNACKGRSKRIGACADTGHWARSGLDPIECLKKVEGRIVSLHFKDLKLPEKHDVPWGTGDCNAAKMLAELKRQGFKGVFSIEYEHNTPELVSNVQKCTEFFGKCAVMSQNDLQALSCK
jgi:sugar phosphate isomerase/epimerase